ncbi:MAG: peptidogalycan biosysnthesis protein, partial [Hyphomicrobium sp.]
MNVEPGEKRGTVANIVARIADIPAVAWDACANPDPASYNPFIAHAFLKALEDSGCVGAARSGWLPQHIAIADEQDEIAACAPCYVKLDSTGEYVFDHAWASAYERAGGEY